MATILNTRLTPGSPMWWVDRLYWRLCQRRPQINKFDDYYRGDFPLPWLAPQAADEFRRVLKMARANYMGLVIDAQCERMAVEGFRINQLDDGSAPDAPLKVNTKADTGFTVSDKATWRIWQANNLDTFFDQGILESAITGNSYLLVAPNFDEPEEPYIWVEHSSQVIVAFAGGSNRRKAEAALKVWVDEWTGKTFATLYLPDSIWKYESKAGDQQIVPDPSRPFDIREAPIWAPRSVEGEMSPAPNPLGVVPMFELPNNPRLLSGGQSELYDLTDTQDRIVKTIVDRMLSQDYDSFPQKWASGWPEYDAAGAPTPPISVGRDRMITTEVAETKFGQFSAGDLLGYIAALQQDIKDIASRSRTPAQYLLGTMDSVSSDALKASESGLVMKVKQRFRGIGDPLEDAMRLARRVAGINTPADQSMETIWRNPEFRTEGELVDALLKMADLGVPEEALWERWGATPTEIERWKAMLDDKMKRAAAGDATVVLAERFRQAAAPVVDPGGTGAKPGAGSGGQSAASARTRRPNAPKAAPSAG